MVKLDKLLYRAPYTELRPPFMQVTEVPKYYGQVHHNVMKVPKVNKVCPKEPLE